MQNGIFPGPYFVDAYPLGKAPFNGCLDRVFSSEASSEPVTPAEAKLWCKIDDSITEDDALITALIKSARQMCEQYVGQSIITRTVTAVINNTNGGVYLPYGPVTSFTSLTDSDGNAIDSDNYKLSGTQFPRLLWPKDSNLTAVYAAGYSSLPEEFKTAIKEQVFFLYNNRGEESERSRDGVVVQQGLSPMAKSILKPLKR